MNYRIEPGGHLQSGVLEWFVLVEIGKFLKSSDLSESALNLAVEHVVNLAR